MVKLRESSRYRRMNHSVLVYGVKMVRELVEEGASLRVVITSDEALIDPNVKAAEILVGNSEILEKITGAQTPEGVAAEVDMPPWSDLATANKILVLDRVSDPGNIGTLIRTAQALGWDGVYLVEGCCDPYNDKALRGAMGATFKMALAEGPWERVERWASQRGWMPYAADVEGLSISTAAQESRIMLVLGSEAHGISDAAKQACTLITIPMGGNMESLNVSVAGGIIMYMLQQDSLV